MCYIFPRAINCLFCVGGDFLVRLSLFVMFLNVSLLWHVVLFYSIFLVLFVFYIIILFYYFILHFILLFYILFRSFWVVVVECFYLLLYYAVFIFVILFSMLYAYFFVNLLHVVYFLLFYYAFFHILCCSRALNHFILYFLLPNPVFSAFINEVLFFFVVFSVVLLFVTLLRSLYIFSGSSLITPFCLIKRDKECKNHKDNGGCTNNDNVSVPPSREATIFTDGSFLM